MPNPIRILTFDVKHGNCHAIWSPSGKLVVIDIGTSDDFSPMKWMKSQNITTIDYLILTHPHDDHLRGFTELDGMAVKVFHRPRNIPTNLIAELDADLKNAWERYDAHYIAPVQDACKFYDVSSAAFDGLSLQFFGGKSDSVNLNNFSVVTVLDYAGLKVVFPGDLENLGWTDLLKNDAFKRAIQGTNILVAAHHGREAGWCAELFDHISPQLILVSDHSETETSYVASYSQKARGAKVSSKATNEIRSRNVVSTRDNGHIDINVSLTTAGYNYTVDVDHH